MGSLGNLIKSSVKNREDKTQNGEIIPVIALILTTPIVQFLYLLKH